MPSPPPQPSPVEALERLWQQGQRPDPFQFLAKSGPCTPDVAAAVLAHDQWQRWHVGQRVPAEEYLRRWPALVTAPKAALDVIYGEFLVRQALGEQPPTAEYLARFPQFAASLREQFALFQVLAKDSPPSPAQRDAKDQRSSDALFATNLPTLPNAVADPAQPPATLGPYALLERLGQGGMGQVYKAHHQHLDRVVALKLIHPDLLREDEAVRRFLREIRAGAQLNHPNIVRAFDANQVGGTTFLVMEYVEGTDLARLVRSKGPLPVDQARDCIRQAALGLQHTFEKGFIHRDIKPSNLLLTTKNVVKVLDLGLARLVQPSTSETTSTLTKSNAVMGTPDYIAPEQTRVAHHVDIRADLYSLGCTFYYLLTGRPPFPEGTAVTKCVQHQTEEPEPVERLRPEVPEAIALVVRRLMAKRPEDRYQTPAELAAVLARLSRSVVPPGAPPEPEPNDVPPWQERQQVQRRGWRRLTLLSGVTLLGTLALLVTLLTRQQSVPPQKTIPEVPPADLITAAWITSVAQMKPDDQGQEVARMLRVLNPGYNGNPVYTLSGNKIYTLSLSVDQITNLGPLRALTGVERLSLTATSPESSKLQDLTPLKGMKLDVFKCNNLPITDLSPLEGMPLGYLTLDGTQVRDLKPLRGTRLSFLSLSKAPVSDLTPLNKMSVGHLVLSHTQIKDLRPLQGSSLRMLDLSYTAITTPVLAALKDLPVLEELWLRHTAVTDLSVLAGLKLVRLDLSGTKVSTLAPFQGMPLQTVGCDDTAVADVSPLRDAPLQSLSCIRTKVTSLEPIRDRPLKTLYLSGSPVEDLTPLAGMQLTALWINGTKIRDLSPLKGMPLTSIQINFEPERDTQVLKSLPKLEQINGKSVTDFWKEVELKAQKIP